MHQLQGQTLSDPKFNNEARNAMIRAMMAAGMISGPNDPRLHGMNAQDCARWMMRANIDPSKFSDPSIRAAFRLAGRIANGDTDAAKELVATARVQQQDKIQAAMRALHGKTLAEDRKSVV